MPTTRYHDEEIEGSVHIPNNWTYANQAARKGAGGLVADDVGKLAKQTDDGSFWRLTNHSPVTWVPYTPPAPAVGDIGKLPFVRTDGSGATKILWSVAVHNTDLTGFQGGTLAEYYHLTNAQHGGLTGGGDATTYHQHDSRYYTETETDTLIANHAGLDTGIHGVGAGDIVGTTLTQTLSNKTLTTPTVADLSNMQHDHSDAANGGGLTAPAISDFTNAQHDHADAAGGGQIDHTDLASIGTNTHAQLDANWTTTDNHINTASAHAVTGQIVGTGGSQTLTNKTLTTPTIGDFSNATHDHLDDTGGGVLTIPAAIDFNFDTATADADPGPGKWRLDSASQPASTYAYVDRESAGGIDLLSPLLDLRNGDHMVIQSRIDLSHFQVWELTSHPINATGYVKLSIGLLDFGGSFANNEECTFRFFYSRTHNWLQALQGGTPNEYYHLTNAQHGALTGGGDSSDHYHASDRARADHTGTQTASTISDFDAEVSNNTDVAANTTHRGSSSGVHGISGDVVGTTDTQTLAAKTLTTPTIADFTNAVHDHEDAVGGGTLSAYSPSLTVTAIKTTNYTAAVNEFVRGNVSGGGFYVQLPTAPTDGSRIVVQNLSLTDTSNVLEVKTGGSDTFALAAGPTSIYITLLFETLDLQYDSGSSVWIVKHVSSPTSFATGFPGIDAQTPIEADDISINTTTRVLTVTPPLGYFNILIEGDGKCRRYRKDGAVNFPAFTDTDGIWFFYFDSTGTPTTTQTPWTSSDLEVIAPVFRIYWNGAKAGDDRIQATAFECHANDMSAPTHIWTHLYGAVWSNGLDIASNALASGSPNADGSNTVVGISSGEIIDDNLRMNVTNSTGSGLWEQDMGDTNPGTLDSTNSGIFDVKFMNGGTVLDTIAGTRFPFPFSGSNIPEYITASGTRTEVTNNYYFSTFISALGDSRNGKFAWILCGTQDFATLTAAQAYTWTDIQNNYPLANDGEIRPLYRLIFQRKSSYDVATKYAVLREVQDLRRAAVTSTTVASGSLPATSVTFSPAGDIIATNVQSAIEELDAEKLAADGSIALAGAWDMGNQSLTNVNMDTGDIATAVTNTEWDAAYTHVSNDGSDHSFIDQDVTGTASPTFAGMTLDGALTNSSGGLTINPATYTRIGTDTPTAATGAGDLFVSGDLEIKTTLFVKGSSIFSSVNGVRFNDNVELFLGTFSDASLHWSTAQTEDAFSMGLGDSRTVIVCDTADRDYNFAHSVQSNPTIIVHSANQSTTEWASITHNQSGGVIETGAGYMRINPATYTSIGSGTPTSATGAGDFFVTNDAEIGGTLYLTDFTNAAHDHTDAASGGTLVHNAVKLQGYDIDNGAPAAGEVLVYDTEDTEWRAENVGVASYHGFENFTDATLSMTDGTQTFNFTTSGCYYWVKGVRKYISTTDTVGITDTSRKNWIYLDGSTGNLSSAASFFDDWIVEHIPVATVTYDATGNATIALVDCRSKFNEKDRFTVLHEWKTKKMRGVAWTGGLGLTGIVADGDGSSNTHAQCGYAAGSIAWCGREWAISADSAPAQIPVYYRTGTGTQWMRYTPTDYPMRQYLGGGANRMAYNSFNGTTWAEAHPSVNEKVCSSVLFATNDPSNPVIVVQGRNENYYYPTAEEQHGDVAISDALRAVHDQSFPFDIAIPIAVLVFETDTAFTNAMNSRVISLFNDDFCDIRNFDKDEKHYGGKTEWTITSSTSFVLHKRIDVDDMAAGFYRISYSYIWGYPDSGSETVANAFIQVHGRVDGASLSLSYMKPQFYGFGNTYPQNSAEVKLYLPAGPHYFDLGLLSNDASYDAYVQQGRFLVERII